MDDKLNTEEFETMRNINEDRRRSRSIQEWLFILALCTNFGGIIWFTARVKSDQENDRQVIAQLVNITDRIVDKQAAQDVSIAVIKAQLKISQ